MVTATGVRADSGRLPLHARTLGDLAESLVLTDADRAASAGPDAAQASRAANTSVAMSLSGSRRYGSVAMTSRVWTLSMTMPPSRSGVFPG
jgi:hypothetical protein